MIGECKPYSITGSLPLVGDMQEAGFDIQVGQGRFADVLSEYKARTDWL